MATYTTIRQAAQEAAEAAARSGWDHAVVKGPEGYTIALAQGSDVDGEVGRARGWAEPLGGVWGDPIEDEAAEAAVEDQADDLAYEIKQQEGA